MPPTLRVLKLTLCAPVASRREMTRRVQYIAGRPAVRGSRSSCQGATLAQQVLPAARFTTCVSGRVGMGHSCCPMCFLAHPGCFLDITQKVWGMVQRQRRWRTKPQWMIAMDGSQAHTSKPTGEGKQANRLAGARACVHSLGRHAGRKQGRHAGRPFRQPQRHGIAEPAASHCLALILLHLHARLQCC